MSQTVQAAVRAGVAQLKDAGIDGAARDAQVLMAHVLGVRTDRLILIGPDPLTEKQAATFDDMIQRRASREPVSHLVGGRMFYDRWFKVTPDVLDPRPETETLIATALARPFQRVLDLGTGSGCILLTLLAERPGTTGIGTDISVQAVSVANENRERLGLTDRATIGQASWYTQVSGRFDLIVSNPPYIAIAEMADLQPEVRDHEPRLALTDEGDGLACYRAIVADAPDFLTPQGYLMVEIGPTQAAAVSQMLVGRGFANITVTQDIDGRDRVVSAQNTGK